MAIAATMSHEDTSDTINDNTKDDHEHDMVMPGFRFHPTEEELVEFYLRRKVEGKRFNVELITFLDLYRYDPWELPGIYLNATQLIDIFLHMMGFNSSSSSLFIQKHQDLMLNLKAHVDPFLWVLFFQISLSCNWRERVVFLRAPRPEVQEWRSAQPCDHIRLLEGDGS